MSKYKRRFVEDDTLAEMSESELKNTYQEEKKQEKRYKKGRKQYG